MRLPFSAFPAPLLFDTFASAMGFFVGIVFFHGFAVWSVSLVTLSLVLSHTYRAPILQSILVSAAFAKLPLVFPLFAFGAFFRFCLCLFHAGYSNPKPDIWQRGVDG